MQLHELVTAIDPLALMDDPQRVDRSDALVATVPMSLIGGSADVERDRE